MSGAAVGGAASRAEVRDVDAPGAEALRDGATVTDRGDDVAAVADLGGEIEGWWAELRAVALVGTARRAAPEPRALAGTAPGPDAVGPERQVLDGAAIAGLALRAGAPLARRDDPLEPAPVDQTPVAPPVAVQLLELLLGQAPAAGVHREDLLRHWYTTCAATGHRLPEPLLVTVLPQVGSTTAARAAVHRVLGARGRWLVAQNPQWAWAAGPDPATSGGSVLDRSSLGGGAAIDTAAIDTAAIDDELALTTDAVAWARLPAAARASSLARRRAVDPAGARALLRSTWSSDAASARASHLAVLADQLGPDDEELLEQALDDRAKSVREVAVELLDGVPTSARAQRMAARLRPLVTVSGRLRTRGIEISLPEAPDDAGVRDGLGTAPPRRSARGWWLERIVAGAPLAIWTELTGDAPDRVLRHLEDDDARRGLLAAAIAQRDAVWAAALFAVMRDARLLDVVAADEREALVVGALRSKLPSAALPTLLAAVPAPWGPKLGALVVTMAREAANAAFFLQPISGVLAEALDDDSAARLESWLAELQRQDNPPTQPSGALRAILQHRSLHRAITEAFA